MHYNLSLFTSSILIVLFYFIDNYYYNKELSNKPAKQPVNFSIQGKINFILLLGVIISVILSGMYKKPLLNEELEWPLSFLLRDIALFSLGIISYKITSMKNYVIQNYDKLLLQCCFSFLSQTAKLNIPHIFFRVFIVGWVFLKDKMGPKGQFLLLIRIVHEPTSFN